VLSSDSARKKLLGISVSERALLIAEVCADGAEAQVLRVAQFSFPQGIGFNQIERLGAAFKEFLHGSGIKCRRAVFGVPAKALILKPQNLPPVDADTARSMLAMQAETQCPPELGAMVFDYAGDSSPTHASSLLLMGLAQKYIDRLKALAEASHLKMLAITPCASALGAATARRIESPLVLSLRADGAELSAQEGSQTRYIRHLGAVSAAASLAIEMRRAAATLPNGWGIGNGHPQIGGRRGLVLWDDVGLDAEALSTLEATLGMPVIRGELASLGRMKIASADTCKTPSPGSPGEGESGGFSSRSPSPHPNPPPEYREREKMSAKVPPSSCAGASAIALTLPLLRGQRLAVDFLHPRLAPPRPKAVPRRVLWASVAAATLLFCIIACYGDIWILQRQITSIDRELQIKEPQLQIARPYVASMQFAEGFRTSSPRHLACLADITAALPPDGQTYLTSFQLKSNMKGEIGGHSASDQSVLGLADRMSKKQFSDIRTRLDARDGKGAGGVSYNITFTYVGGGAHEPPLTRVAAAK
jgi:hypothetical protein